MNAWPTGDQRSPQRQLIEWQIEHADLDAAIDQMALQATGVRDELALRRLKKRRLFLRDRITQLQLLLTPQEPA